ncbi:unnamed protein product [Didymodactylos carnosus]|uniref:Uncharacterized protein n=1 Tax=Didymodactylos carnosus TaxID=1234261 RepID=A0A815H7Q4_9BILA|nr:unnamed protein product [Didymodactylos carnosus]CAF4220151.1 unnamed protein product [Didymodactylos carnosus]
MSALIKMYAKKTNTLEPCDGTDDSGYFNSVKNIGLEKDAKTQKIKSDDTMEFRMTPVPIYNKEQMEQLYWREVCDGKIDCWHAIDESSMCFELERNHCDNELEYRCRMGTCISKSFGFDIYPDCMDDSDEVDTKVVTRRYSVRMFSSTIECGEHFCGHAQFSCNDGQCLRNYFH